MIRRPRRLKSKYALFRAIREADNFDNYSTIINYIDKHGNRHLVTDNSGNGPIHLAVLHHKCDLVHGLLALRKLHVNQSNEDGNTPLHLSLREPCESCFDALIRAGADVNQANNKQEVPLHLAVYYDVDYVHRLIQFGALNSINARNFHGFTPIAVAIHKNKSENVHLLLYYGADTTIAALGGYTPFMLSIKQKHHELSKYLLEFVTNFTRTDGCGYSALYLAIHYSSPIVEELIRRQPVMEYSRPVYNVLRYCIFRNFEGIFRKVWAKISFNNVDTSFYSLLRAARDYNKHTFVDVILYSDRLKIIFDCLNLEHPISYITSFTRYGYPQRNVVYASFILLSNGLVPTMKDIEYVFLDYGYCDLFRTLLFIKPRSDNGICIIPRIIFCVNLKVNDIITSYQDRDFILSFNRLDYVRFSKNLKTFFEYCTSEILYSSISVLSIRFLGREIRVAPFRRIPSLLEISRNEARYVIYRNYNIRDTSHFYTVLDQLPIPRICKDIIAFKIPLYENVEVISS